MSFTNIYEHSKHIAFLKRNIFSYHFNTEAVWQGFYKENKTRWSHYCRLCIVWPQFSISCQWKLSRTMIVKRPCMLLVRRAICGKVHWNDVTWAYIGPSIIFVGRKGCLSTVESTFFWFKKYHSSSEEKVDLCWKCI
jgi:hypothetical protein